MADPRAWLFIPVETKVREYHSKLLLGACAARTGFEVVFGEQQELKRKLEFLPRGIVLEKGITTHQATELKRAQSMGHRLAAWCEEGLVYRNRAAYLRDRICPEAMEFVDLFFAWGGRQAEDVLTKLPDAREKLIVTGNPRFDLLRPELRGLFRAQAEQFRERYGRYVLIATNFGRVNHFRGAEFVGKLLVARGARETPEWSDFADQWTSFLTEIYRAFRSMVPRLARCFPDTTFVLRPHPSENKESWKTALAGEPNVAIVHEGSVIPWIVGAQALIHNSCTTGVESYLLDVPAISYRPVKSEALDSKLPNALSHQACTCEELVEVTRAAISGGDVPGFTSEEENRREAILGSYVDAFRGPMAAERIVEALARVPVQPQKLEDTGARRVSMLATDTISSVRTAIAAGTGRLVVGRTYHRHKFPGLDLAELTRSLEELARFSEGLRGITATQIGGMRDVFRITSEAGARAA